LALNAFLRPHLERLAASYRITVCVNEDDSEVACRITEQVRLIPFKIVRKINLPADLGALIALIRLFRRERFDLVFSLTPKAGLLAMLAARLAGVPRRVHCFTGQVWATQSGLGRWFLKSLDRLLSLCATRLLADSRSQRHFLIEEGVVAEGKIEVLANGSMAGVDVRRFCPDSKVRREMRLRFGIDEEACCLLYVGRLKRDKGVPDLVEAFKRLQSRFPNLHLLLVGPDEEGLDPHLRGVPRLHRVGYSPTVEGYMAAADIFCLPSYREGFGLVLIEAGAAGLPVVASRIYGITDAVIEGENGLLYRPGDIADLSGKLSILIESAPLRRAYGEAGRHRAMTLFSVDTVTEAMADFLHRHLGEAAHRWTAAALRDSSR
jgi:glycosyltransferase involved in cell wall biosynthesis